MARRQHPIYEAYVEAWKERRRTGTVDDAVLLDSLARHPVPDGDESLSPRATEVLLDMWRQGTSPRMLMPRAAAEALRANWWAFRELWAVFTGPGSVPPWMNIPDGGEGVTFRGIGSRVRRLPFEPAPSVDHVWRRVSRRYRDYEGRATARVWLEMLGEDSQARVMVGKHAVGRTRLDGGDWRQLHQAARHRVFADGSLKVRKTAGGGYECGRLRVYVPRSQITETG